MTGAMNRKWLVVGGLLGLSVLMYYGKEISKVSGTLTANQRFSWGGGGGGVDGGSGGVSDSAAIGAWVMPETRQLREYSKADSVSAFTVEEKHDKWIIVTTISLPTPDVIYMAKLKGWKMVVCGDTKTPKEWSYPGVVYLSIKDQEAMGLNTGKLTPYKSYARKNMGYLYAIAAGAKIIYETDDDNKALDNLTGFILTDRTPGLVYAGAGLFNPYVHFGQPSLWPRGFPLSQISASAQQLPHYRLSKSWRSPLIQQGVVNGDPDMDAIFRLTRKPSTERLDVTFDPHAPPAILPEGVFAPFNSQNTLFHYDALWAMVLPITVSFRLCDIWRGYFVQRLIWEINGNLAFFPANAYQLRNSHSYLADAESEDQMYHQTERFINFLSNWTCPADFSFFNCVHDLASAMAKNEFWGAGDVDLIDSWLKDLVSIGYKEPTRVAPRVDTSKLQDKNMTILQSSGYWPNNKILAKRWYQKVTSGTFTVFKAAAQDPPGLEPKDAKLELVKPFASLAPVLHHCKDVKDFKVTLDQIKVKYRGNFDNVLLVVVFNFIKIKNENWFGKSLGPLEAQHRPVFPNIIYCGEDPEGKIVWPAMKALGQEVSFLSTYMMNGYTGYNCFLRATNMGYNVSDYLMVSDDTLLNTWSLESLDRNKVWKPPYVKWSCKEKRQWGQFNKDKPRLDAGFKAIEAKYGNNPIVEDLTFKMFMDQLGRDTCMWAISDNYYIPKKYVKKAAALYEELSPQRVLIEILTPILIHGIAPADDIVTLEVKDLWTYDREKPWDFYGPSNSHFLHPIKWSGAANHEPFCKYHLAHILNYKNSGFIYQGKRYKETLRKWTPP